MEISTGSTIGQPTDRWWKIPSWEEVLLIGIKYRAVLLGVVVAILVLYAQERLSVMDHRLFRPSYEGVQGLVQYQLGHYAKAAQVYRADLRNEGWREWDIGQEAYTALLRGNLSEAARIADLQLTHQPDDIEAWLTQGEVALEKGNLRQASEAFDHAVFLNDKHYDALLLSAVAHSRSGDFDHAIDQLRRALRNNFVGDRITAHLWALETAGDIREDAPDGIAWCLLAHYYRYLRIFDPTNAAWARDAAFKAINSGSRVDDAYITLGILEEKTGDYDAALPYFLKAVEANPRNPEAYRWAANMYRHRGNDLLNEYKMQKGAYTASPLDGFYREGLVSFLIYRFGDYPQALDLVRQAVNDEPQNKDLLVQLADLYQRLGQYEDAIQFYRDILKTDAHNVSVLDAIGSSLASLGRYDEAAASYERALAISFRHPQSHSGLGAVYALQGRNADSIREYETALQVGGDNIHTRAFLCNQYWATNRYHDAEACLKHVLRQDPHNKSAMQLYPYVMKGLEHEKHER